MCNCYILYYNKYLDFTLWVIANLKFDLWVIVGFKGNRNPEAYVTLCLGRSIQGRSLQMLVLTDLKSASY